MLFKDMKKSIGNGRHLNTIKVYGRSTSNAYDRFFIFSYTVVCVCGYTNLLEYSET